jgi:hypothetical protein
MKAIASGIFYHEGQIKIYAEEMSKLKPHLGDYRIKNTDRETDPVRIEYFRNKRQWLEHKACRSQLLMMLNPASIHN